jgi:hypothetical protein
VRKCVPFGSWQCKKTPQAIVHAERAPALQSAENKKWKEEEEKHIDVTTTKWASAIASKHG